jgi:CBS domain-containing protein
MRGERLQPRLLSHPVECSATLDAAAMKKIPAVKTVMTTFPHAVDADAPLREARSFMQTHRIRHLPVTERRKLAGVVTDRDIKLMLGPDFDCPDEQELTVRDAWVADAYVVDLNEPLDNVLMNMAERHIGSALVTQHGKLAGVFTTTDACRALARVLRERFPPRTPGTEAA